MWLAYKLQMGYVLTMFYIYYEKTFLFFFFLIETGLFLVVSFLDQNSKTNLTYAG